MNFHLVYAQFSVRVDKMNWEFCPTRQEVAALSMGRAEGVFV
jgi:hypothetical protein